MPQFGYQTLGFGGGSSKVLYGPPEFDAVSVNNASTGPSTQTSSHAIGSSGVGRGLVVIIAQLNSGSAPADPTGVTYDGVAMTKQVSKKDYER